MNIGYIVQQFYPSAYGSGIHAFELSQELAKLGHEIHVITKGEPTQTAYEHFKNIHIHRILRSLHLPYYLPLNSGLLWHYGQEIIRKFDIDVIIGHGFEASLYFKFRKSIPFIYKAVGTIGLQAYRSNLTWQDTFGKLYFPMLGQLEKTAAKQSDCVIAISDAIKHELITNYKIAPQMISRIYNGVNTRRFSPSQRSSQIRERLEISSQKIVIFVGRLSPIKGPHLLVQAIPTITKTFSDIVFLFIGDGPLSSYLYHMVRKLNISHFVKFLGFISNSEISKYFATADLCIIPSLYEPFGLVALESLASGTPILSSARGGLAEIQNIMDGFPTITPLTPSALSKNVITLLSDYEKLKSLGEKGRKLVCHNFSWEKCAQKTSNVIEKIKNKRKKIKGF